MVEALCCCCLGASKGDDEDESFLFVAVVVDDVAEELTWDWEGGGGGGGGARLAREWILDAEEEGWEEGGRGWLAEKRGSGCCEKREAWLMWDRRNEGIGGWCEAVKKNTTNKEGS